MNSATTGSLKIQEAMAAHTHPDYDTLPESIKATHTPEGFAWLGEERYRIVERETQPDWDVTE